MKILSLFSRKPRTYETITTSLRQLADELQDHADDQENAAQEAALTAQHHQAVQSAAEAEARRARSTAEKVAALLD